MTRTRGLMYLSTFVTAGLVAATWTLPAAALHGATLHVGVCKAEITPVSPGLVGAYEAAFGETAEINHSDPVNMAGFGTGRAAESYHDRLWARGVVIQSRGVRVAIVSLDVVGYFKNEIDTIRALISPESGIEHLIVSSTHQHEGPDTLGIWGPDDLSTGIDFAYLDHVNATVAACVDDAAAHMEGARMYLATGFSDGLSLGLDDEDDGFGVSDGKVLAGDDLLAPETEGRIVDPTIATMQFTTRRWPFHPLATLVNFGSHPESMGSNNTAITSDFPHFVRERIEAEYGGVGVWMAGDLGVLQGPLDIDVEDPETGAPAARRSFRFAEVHGTQLADRAIEAIDDARFFYFSFHFWGRVFEFRIPRPGDVFPRIQYASVDPVAVRLDNPFFRFLIGVGVLDVRRQLFTGGEPDPSVGFPFPPPFDPIPQALGEDLHTELSLLRIGSARMVAVPTELDPQIGFAYRDELVAAGARHTFISGLANDEIGYQVPADKWDPSCHECAPFILGGVPELCPAFPNIDCSTVFQNNAGTDVDPAISDAFYQALEAMP